MPPGCPFAPRCPLHVEACDEAEPPLFQVGRGHSAACIRTEEVARAHGHAAEVFSETASDTVLAGESLPADLALGDDAGDATVGDNPPPDQTEPVSGGPDTGSIISTHRGTQDGDRA
jgi:peptide/nickel transport system ATP-binding protein